MSTVTPIPGATPRYDDDGNEVIDLATCGTCGRTWNDAAVSGITPAPSGRCPFEYDHEDTDDPQIRLRRIGERIATKERQLWKLYAAYIETAREVLR